MRLNHTILMATFLTFTAPAFADEYVMMKVNNQDISSAEVQHVWKGLFPEGKAPAFETAKPDVRERVLRAVMAEKLVYNDAIKQGADKAPKLVQELEDVKKKLVVRSFLDAKTAAMITDADLLRDYDAIVSTTKDEKEVRARHILLATEDEAKAAKKKLDAGKGFEELAKELSKDPGSATKGGDLGYFTKDKMVKEFANAAFSMKKGELSGPVKSSFGYHLIKVEDARKVAAPAFSEVKDQLRGAQQQKKLNEYITALIKSADVKTFNAKGKELPFAKDMPAVNGEKSSSNAKTEKPATEEKSTKTAADEKSTGAKNSETVENPAKPIKAEKAN